MKIRTLLVLLVLYTASGCEGTRAPAGPTPPAEARTVSARVEGRVIDGDRDLAVQGAIVSPVAVCGPRHCDQVNDPAASVITDDQGRFVLSVILPDGWSRLTVRVTGSGFEPTQDNVTPAQATGAVLRLLSTVTIRAGESIETRVFLGPQFCGGDSWPCRQVFVEAPSGVSLDIEVFPSEERVVTLIVGPEPSHPYEPTIQRRVTMPRGELWVYGEVGKVTLTATLMR
jgi:hypothetical protein